MNNKGAMQYQQSLTDKELECISFLAANSQSSQRDLSAHLGFSLGMTNIILKRLIKTGIIKTKALNQRKVQYLLTPKGFLEKTKKTYQYFFKTIDSVRDIKNAIQKMILSQYSLGYKNYFIVGNNELADMVEIAMRDMKISDIAFCMSKFNQTMLSSSCVVVNTERDNKVNFKSEKNIHVISELTKYLN